MAEKTRAIIVEDEDLYRDLLRMSLSQYTDIQVAGAYRDPYHVLDGPAVAAADVALLDIDLGSDMNGFELGLRLRQAQPRLGIVFLSNYAENAIVTVLNRRQLTGWSYLLKKSVCDVATLSRAITAVAQGLIVVDPEITRHRWPRPRSSLSQLTARQLEVVALIAQGYTNAAIADMLGIKRKSVENAINEIYSRLHLAGSTGFIEPRVATVLCYLRETHAASAAHGGISPSEGN